jgi:hypothetical protein
VNLFFILQQKGVLTQAEAAEAVDKAVLTLETHQHRAGPDRQADFEGARRILESLRDVISEQ